MKPLADQSLSEVRGASHIREGHSALAAGDDQAALAYFESAAKFDVDDAALLYEGTAQALRNLGQIRGALSILDAGLARFPGHASLRLIRALILLGNHQFAAGWPDYEVRLKSPQAQYLPRRITFPRWNGEPLAGRKILVWSEQGFGDEIMFASLLTRLTRQGAAVTLECSRECAPLFRRSFAHVLEVVTRDFDGGMSAAIHGRHFDYDVPLASIAQHFIRNVGDFLPRAYLDAEQAQVNTTREVFKKLDFKHIVGLSWRGGTVATRAASRTLSLPQVCRILDENPRTLFISLQHNATVDELAVFRGRRKNFIHWSGHVMYLPALANLAGACDFVVTVCNTNVHLAGALGKKVLCLAPFVPEWRYGFKGVQREPNGPDFMPWYKNVRVYRQARYGNWNSIVERVSRLVYCGCDSNYPNL